MNMRKWFYLFWVIWSCQPVFAAVPDDTLKALKVAEAQFDQGLYQEALQILQQTPHLLTLIPEFSILGRSESAKIFYDIGCCYLALGDSLMAEQAFKRALSYDGDISEGFFELADPGHFWLQMQIPKSTTRLSAAIRSAVLPGWGQFYRGHNIRGKLLLGATVSAFTLWVLQKRAYDRALATYKTTTQQDVLRGTWYKNNDGTLYSEFEARFRVVQSRASRTNRLLFLLGGIWLLNVTDAVLVGPNQVALQLPIK